MALFIGLATFSLERITPLNNYFPYVAGSFIVTLFVFAIAILFGFFAYEPKKFLSPDPQKFIEEYANRPLAEYLHYYGGDIIRRIKYSRDANSDKAWKINIAMLFVILGIASIIIYAALLLTAIQLPLEV